MTKLLSTILAGVFFFTSMTGMGQWSFSAPVMAKSFDLDDEDDDFGDEEKEEEPAKESSASLDDEEFGSDFEDKPAVEEKKDPFDEPPARTETRDEAASFDDGGAKSIGAFYFFADSTAEKKAQDIARMVGAYLKDLPGYRYMEAEARMFNDFAFDRLKEDLGKAETLLSEGKKYLDDAEPEEAIGKLNAALDLLEKRIDVMYDTTLLQKVLFRIGASWKLIEEDDKAKDYFKRLLVLNPDYEPDEMSTIEDTRDFFDTTKSGMMMQPLGDLKVLSEPAGATVYIDGRIAGMTPARIEGLVAGKHYWRIHKSGYRDIGGVVSVYDGAEAKVDELLRAGDGADAAIDWQKSGIDAFGAADMMKAGVAVANAAKLDRLFAVHAAVEQADEGTMAKIQLRLIDPKKEAFKEKSVSFTLPGSGDMSRAEDLRTALEDMFVDEYGFNPISSIVSGSLSMGGGKKSDDDSIATKWWFWTIIGVVVAGAAGGGTAAALLLTQKKTSGASMTVDFGH